MGREIRRVPMGWQHPKDEHGRFISLFDQTYEEALARYNADKAAFESDPDEQAVARERGCMTYKEWADSPPKPEWYRPAWGADAVMGWCYYENVSEGTPMSPVFEKPEQLIVWLVEHERMSVAGAMALIQRGYAFTLERRPDVGLISGIEAIDLDTNQGE